MILLLVLALPLFADDDFPYVYARANGNVMVMRGSVQQLVRLKDRYQGEYYWARVDGVEYLIRDAATLDQIEAAFAPLDALRPEQQALEHKMKPVENQAERIESELDDLTDRDEDDDALTDEEEQRVDRLRRELKKVNRELRVYEEQERDLDQKEEELERVAEGKMAKIVRAAIRNGVAQRAK